MGAIISLAGKHLAIDGKTLRGSGGENAPVHLISAFVSEAQAVRP
jgi:hypothetical protein